MYFLDPKGLIITAPFKVDIAATTFAPAEKTSEKETNTQIISLIKRQLIISPIRK